MEDIRLLVRSNVNDHDKPDNKKERLTFQSFRSDYSPPALPPPIPFPLTNSCWYHRHHPPVSGPKWLLRTRKTEIANGIPTTPTALAPALLRQSERNGDQRRRSWSRVSYWITAFFTRSGESESHDPIGDHCRGPAGEEAWLIGWFWERSHLFNQVHTIDKFSFLFKPLSPNSCRSVDNVGLVTVGFWKIEKMTRMWVNFVYPESSTIDIHWLVSRKMLGEGEGNVSMGRADSWMISWSPSTAMGLYLFWRFFNLKYEPNVKTIEKARKHKKITSTTSKLSSHAQEVAVKEPSRDLRRLVSH